MPRQNQINIHISLSDRDTECGWYANRRRQELSWENWRYPLSGMGRWGNQ